MYLKRTEDASHSIGCKAIRQSVCFCYLRSQICNLQEPESCCCSLEDHFFYGKTTLKSQRRTLNRCQLCIFRPLLTTRLPPGGLCVTLSCSRHSALFFFFFKGGMSFIIRSVYCRYQARCEHNGINQMEESFLSVNRVKCSHVYQLGCHSVNHIWVKLSLIIPEHGCVHFQTWRPNCEMWLRCKRKREIMAVGGRAGCGCDTLMQIAFSVYYISDFLSYEKAIPNVESCVFCWDLCFCVMSYELFSFLWTCFPCPTLGFLTSCLLFIILLLINE